MTGANRLRMAPSSRAGRNTRASEAPDPAVERLFRKLASLPLDEAKARIEKGLLGGRNFFLYFRLALWLERHPS